VTKSSSSLFWKLIAAHLRRCTEARLTCAKRTKAWMRRDLRVVPSLPDFLSIFLLLTTVAHDTTAASSSLPLACRLRRSIAKHTAFLESLTGLQRGVRRRARRRPLSNLMDVGPITGLFVTGPNWAVGSVCVAGGRSKGPAILVDKIAPGRGRGDGTTTPRRGSPVGLRREMGKGGDLWDDSALVHAFDRAVSTFKVRALVPGLGFWEMA
jgi:hypothetical protein